MVSNRTAAFALVMLAAASAGAVACAGPETGTITFGTGESAVTDNGKDKDTSTSTNNNEPAPGAGGPVNATFKSETYEAVAACGTCHLPQTGGAPKFFGENADTTYPLFKAAGYHLANSKFMTKGAHNGPALTADQVAAMNKWIASEAGGAATGDGGM